MAEVNLLHRYPRAKRNIEKRTVAQSEENIRIAEERAVKQRFCEMLMTKYGKSHTGRPKGFFPRLDAITVYAITIERMTGKEMALPPLSKQWPAMDRTKTPNARP